MMTDIRPYLEVGDRLSAEIKRRVPPPPLDGTAEQNRADVEMRDRLEQLHAKQLAEVFWHEKQRRDHVLETAGRMRAGAAREAVSAAIL